MVLYNRELRKFLQIGDEKELTEHVKVINEYAASVIKKRKDTDNIKALAEKPDLLSRFITWGHENNESLSDKDLRDIIINFIVAGRDTTAVLLSWATYELTQHPEWEEKLLDAIRQQDAKHQKHRNELDESNDNFDEYDEISHIPILQAFLHECLRLHPSVPMDNKEAVKDDTLPDGSFIAAGTLVGYSPYMYGRSKRLWGADADEFKPERWLDATSRTGLKEVSQFKFLTFNAGPRLCLGKGMCCKHNIV
jgi:cytochrome P450